MLRGRIIKGVGGFYYIDTENGLYECKARGIFRKEKITPLVGDTVEIQVIDEETKKGVIERIFDRKSELIRPSISNVDTAVIIFAAKDPDPSFSLLDRFIVLAEKENLEIIICINKIDSDDTGAFLQVKKTYESCGYPIIAISTFTGEGLGELREAIEGKTVVFSGPSGVGKSSILNALDSNLQLKTGDISKKLGRGKHTTRHAELLRLDENTTVADTPGFSSLTVNHIAEKELKDYFVEFTKYEEDCRFFTDCIHESEPGCAVKKAVENGEISLRRYDSYIQLINEIRDSTRRYK
ncbi:putative ribosome biogenesis GTPase RsgA [Peptoclostridium acidaminophilum DSM 3953]|uniref:Small ribosomal subunit biogenesis GTPase RsgA n=1 Tax=Peptoclostridium acidaminophilum DSM 3953 TaxID=1286171 RepID=W8U793_PEPAC|nr:ribosome small subunit-dependent GTPase A [Peptoclostridium acidaminophilum]AHM56761.1 putative ribosome biogenesis GTPase RsgA [Peptoclostridium acidaminophilum DSM 3953]